MGSRSSSASPKNSAQSRLSNASMGNVRLADGLDFFSRGWQAVRTLSTNSKTDSSSAESLFSDVNADEVEAAIMKLPEGYDSDQTSKSIYPRVAHSVMLVGMAINDVLHYAGNPDVSSPSVGCFVLLPYVAAASWAIFSKTCISQRGLSHRFSALILTLMQVTASVLSSCWRTEFKANVAEFGDHRAAYSVCLLQVLTAICHPMDPADVFLTSLISLVPMFVIQLAQVAPALSILQDCILITCSGISCGIGVHHARVRKRAEINNSTLMELFAPFTAPDFEPGSKMRTNLDRLTGKIYATRENIRRSRVQTEWLWLFSSLLKSVLKELTNVGSLMNVADHELSCEPAVMREYFKKTFSSVCTISATSSQQCENHCASMGGGDLPNPRKSVSVEEAMKDMVSFLASRDPDHAGTLPLPAVPEQMQDMVLSSGLGTWNFDIFKFSALCQGRPLVAAGNEALKLLSEKLQLDAMTITRFVDSIEARYRSSNAYHNSLHAADVLNSMCYFFRLKQSPSLINLSMLERFSAMMASVVHDVGHTGQSNRFHANALTPLALLFSDQAILESMHSAITFAVLQTKECNFLAALDPSARAQFRGLVIQMILDTDLAKHVQTVSRFKQEMLSDEALKRSPLNPNQRKELLSFIMKTADVGGSSKLFDLHLQWTLRINTEFFDQGDAEKNLGLTCSPFCDRANTKVAESQRGFFKFIVMPLYNAINEYLSDSRMKFEVNNELHANFAFWQKYKDEDFNYADPMSNAQALRKRFRDMEEKACDGSPEKSRSRHSFGSSSEKTQLFAEPSAMKRSNSDSNVRIGRQDGIP